MNRDFSLFLQNIGARFLKLKYSQRTFLIIFLVFFKSSIGIEFGNIKSDYLPAALELPKPKAYYSSSLGNLLIAKILYIRSVNSFVLLHVFLIIGVILAIFFYLNRFIKERDFLLLVLFTSSGFASLFNTIGKYDPLVFIGGVLLGIANTNITFFLGLFLMLLGNPEQAIIGIILLLVVRHAVQSKIDGRILKIGLLIAIFYFLIIQIWMISNGVIGNRLTLILYFLKLSLLHFIENPFANVWVWLGSGWLIVTIFAFSECSRIGRRNLFIAFASASLITAITADGVRVFSLITLPVYTSLIFAFSQSSWYRNRSELFLGAYLLFWISTPQTLSGWGIPSQFIEKYILVHLDGLTRLTILVEKYFYNIMT